MKEIPMSLYIADVNAKLKQIVNHPQLPPSVIEALLRAAHLQASINADIELEEDYKKYNEEKEEGQE